METRVRPKGTLSRVLPSWRRCSAERSKRASSPSRIDESFTNAEPMGEYSDVTHW